MDTNYKLDKKMKLSSNHNKMWFADARTNPDLICCICGELTNENRHKDCGRCPHAKCSVCRIAVGEHHTITTPVLYVSRTKIQYIKDIWSSHDLNNIFDIPFDVILDNRQTGVYRKSYIWYSDITLKNLYLCYICLERSKVRPLIMTKNFGKVEFFDKE